MKERGWSTTDSRSLAPSEPATTYSPLLPRQAPPAQSRSATQVESRGGGGGVGNREASPPGSYPLTLPPPLLLPWPTQSSSPSEPGICRGLPPRRRSCLGHACGGRTSGAAGVCAQAL